MKTLRLSTSVLQDLAKCDTKVVLKDLGYGGLRSSGAMEVGSAIHEGLAEHFRGHSREAAIAALEAEYNKYPETWTPELLEEKPRYALANVRDILSFWLNKHPLESLPITIERPEHVEVPFEIPVGEIRVAGEDILVVMKGRLDLLGREGDHLMVWENKTTSARLDAKWKGQFICDPQNCCYQWAAAETLGEPVIGSYINAIQISKLPDSNRKCKNSEHEGMTYAQCGRQHVNTEVFYVFREEEQIAEWKSDVLDFARTYVKIASLYLPSGIQGARDARARGRWNNSCDYCEYSTWCNKSKRQVQFADSMMSHNREPLIRLEDGEEKLVA